MHVYRQATGIWTYKGKYIAHGYSGYEQGKNNPLAQEIHNIGPLPVGHYEMVDLLAPSELARHGFGSPVIRLCPRRGVEQYGRGGFLIHGDSIGRPGSASHGCIILPKAIRLEIWETEDRDLEVISGLDSEQVAA